MVIDEASEREQVANRGMIGHQREIGEAEIWQNVARNLSQQPLKLTAVSVAQKREMRIDERHEYAP